MAHLGLAQIPPANLDIPILGHQAASQGLPLGDALEPGSLEVVGFPHRSGVGRSGSSR
jgi:hypothetical protein